jgi:tRNA dimethylallyltransferase
VRALEIAVHAGEEGEPWPEIAALTLGIRWERAALRERITKRLRERLAAGLIEEVERLHAQGTSWEQLEFYGLEYRFVARYLKGELARNDMSQKLNIAIHQFAKKQETWFRRMESQGIRIHWLNGAGDPLSEALEVMRTVRRNAAT